MRLYIMGSHGFEDTELFKKSIDEFVEKNGKPTEVLLGGLFTTDKMSEEWAKENNLETTHYRNQLFARFSNSNEENKDENDDLKHFLIFHRDGAPRTKRTIDYAKEKEDNVVMVVEFERNK